MYDQRYPNLVRMDSVPRGVAAAAREVCRRCDLDAAFDKSTGSVFFHLPGKPDIGVWREDCRRRDTGWMNWDSSVVDRICRITNTRKMEEKHKLAAVEAAKAAEAHEDSEKHGNQMEVFERESHKALKRIRNRRGMHKGYRPSIVVDKGVG